MNFSTSLLSLSGLLTYNLTLLSQAQAQPTAMKHLPSRHEFLSGGLEHYKPPPNQQAICSICLEQITPGSSQRCGVQVPSCSHVFHKKCLKTWLQRQHNNTCPTCREELFLDPYERQREHIEQSEFAYASPLTRWTTVGILNEQRRRAAERDLELGNINHELRGMQESRSAWQKFIGRFGAGES